MSRSDRHRHWLDTPRNVDKLVYALWAACAALIAVEFLYRKHPSFGFDGWFAFYPVVGFLSYGLILLCARGLRRLVRRDEDYYLEEPGDGGGDE